MHQKKTIMQFLTISIIVVFVAVCLSGCTTNQTSTSNTNKLIGAWSGTMQMSMFGGNGNVSVSEVTFNDSDVKLTMESERGSYTMSYAYTVNGYTLVLEPLGLGRGGFPGGFPGNGTYPGNGQWNGTRPPINGTWPSNGTRPNGSWPSNGTRSSNGTRFPGGGRQQLSFEYSFNEENTVLYLNGAEFVKIQ